MNNILVSGLTNIETSIQIDKFPVEYSSCDFIFDRISTAVSGVGYNVSKALTVLGNKVNYLTILGEDINSQIIKNVMIKNNINTEYIYNYKGETAQSINLYNKVGKRKIMVDLKKIQDIEYPIEDFEEASKDCKTLILCNVNFSRKMLLKRRTDQIIATDIHAIKSLDDEYNNDFIKSSDIVFLSSDNLEISPEKIIRQMIIDYDVNIAVVGMGSSGCIMGLADNKKIIRFPAIDTRKKVNTIGAGDSLFSSFIHFYNKTEDPYNSIENATIFASWKIGEKSASEGFLTEYQVLNKKKEIKKKDKNIFDFQELPL